MEKEGWRIPKAARYPLFFLGLLLIIVGGLTAKSVNAPISAVFGIGMMGFILLILSVAIR